MIAAIISSMVTSLVLNKLLIGSLNQILSTIPVLSILSHNSLVNTTVPKNSQIFFAALNTIVAFDIVETEHVLS